MKKLFDHIYFFFFFCDAVELQCDLFCFFKIDLLVYRYHNTFQEELFDDRRCLDLHSVSQLFDRHGFRKCDGFDFIFLLLLYRWCRLFYLLLVILSAAAVIILGIIFSSLTQTVALALEFINFILTVVSSTVIAVSGFFGDRFFHHCGTAAHTASLISSAGWSLTVISASLALISGVIIAITETSASILAVSSWSSLLTCAVLTVTILCLTILSIILAVVSASLLSFCSIL